ncbi:hypothetical protein GGTG_04508 [Gaeumannomyces tritici R3-111a-1]|uniref:Uncharacterized protein n=1 Tax=Gaeumannomyces tritici (strain R3-111a-1) TaxID=644352 RepID=J3NTA9_GAET3|nr:hypothetical protein GGTG_04508 [Gaeumannomyces tritici R3-111a-1]EJT79424.1 hypothetical protein GGTG_04508 [Gaeumannomyces tritici R3-111a-1]
MSGRGQEQAAKVAGTGEVRERALAGFGMPLMHGEADGRVCLHPIFLLARPGTSQLHTGYSWTPSSWGRLAAPAPIKRPATHLRRQLRPHSSS